MSRAARPLKTAMGARVRQLREQAGLTQDALVLKARSWGLTWTGSTLAKVELGDRSVGFDEAPLLAGALEVRLADLVPAGWISLSPGAAISGEAFQKLLLGAHPLKDLPARVFDVEWSRRTRRTITEFLAGELETMARVEKVWPEASVKTMHLAREAAAGETEKRAARRLGLHAEQLSMLAYRLWDMSLTEKRDQRLREQSHPRGASTAALRGHVTRALTAELAAAHAQFTARGGRRMRTGSSVSRRQQPRRGQ